MRTLFLFLPLLLTAGCRDEHAHHHHDDDEAHEQHANHDHQPRMGGQLVELGDHFAQIELLLDPKAGKLTALVWDGHVKKAIPIDAGTLSITLEDDEGEFEVPLAAIADKLSGDTEKRASKFTGRSDRLKGLEHCSGFVGEMTIRGKKLPATPFELGQDHDEDHE